MSSHRSLPLIRAHERMDYKRCEKKWYWKWRRGLVPKSTPFSALDLGSWIHVGFSKWYGKGTVRHGSLREHVRSSAAEALRLANAGGMPDYRLEEGDKLAMLAEEVAGAYEAHYGQDENVHVLAAEIPLEFVIAGKDDRPLAIHRLKPDLVFRDQHGFIWLMEHKTASQIRAEHLVIDDQARPYGAMAERALRKLGVLKDGDAFKGVTYNFLRKVLPDTRETNAKGEYLNRDGSVSKRQPTTPQFVRLPLFMTRRARAIALHRAQQEAFEITRMARMLQAREINPDALSKTPHYSCPRFCPFFSMCAAEEQGVDVREMERTLFMRRDPYAYEDSTDENVSW